MSAANSTTKLNDDCMVLRRPHYNLDHDELTFLVSRRACRRLTPEECAVWMAIEQPILLSDLRNRCGKHTDTVVAAFREAELCETIEADFAKERRRVLVVEPHADDAALSLGGTLWRRRHECAFTIATMASRSNFTSYYYLDREYFSVNKICSLRDAESALFARMIGGTHFGVGLTDATLRYRDEDWSLDYFRRYRGAIAAATARRPDTAERERWMLAARRLLAMPGFDEVWLPQGSPHADHALTTESCLSVLVREPELRAGRTLYLYQDVPYAARYPEYSTNMTHALTVAGFELEPEVVSIDDFIEPKMRLISAYASQFKMHSMRADIEASARLVRNETGFGELLWKVLRFPEELPLEGVFPVVKAHRNSAIRTRAWIRRNAGRQKLRILLLLPTGRWQSDLELLRMTFPRARLDIYSAPSALPEVERGLEKSATTEAIIHPVGAGSKAWSALGLRLAFKRPMPTLFYVGKKRRRLASAMAMLWPLSDTLVLDSMDEFIQEITATSFGQEGAA